MDNIGTVSYISAFWSVPYCYMVWPLFTAILRQFIWNYKHSVQCHMF